MRKSTSIAAVVALLISSVAFAGSIDPKVQKAIDAAIAANKKADSVGFEWRDAQKMIKQAKAAAEKGDNAKAMKLAEKARKQGELGYQQYLDQRSAGPRF